MISMGNTKIFHYLHSHYRLGGAKIIKPHCLTVFIGETVIDMKFTRKDYELMWIMHKIVRREMKLNLKYSLKP